MSSVRGISIFKTSSEFFNLQRFGDAEFRIRMGLVNARIKNSQRIFAMTQSSVPFGLRPLQNGSRSTMFTGISGSKHWRNCFQTFLVPATLAQLEKSAGLFLDLAHRN